jgi:16S rRNA processing protein RimM
MNKSDCYFLGSITKLHGYSGELTVFLDVDKPENYKSLKSILIEVNMELVPYFVQQVSFKQNSVVLKLEDVETAEQAAILVHCNIYLPLSQLPPLTGKRFYFHEVIGFEVIDAQEGPLGEITKILDLPKQAVIELFYKGKEVLIPVTEEIINAVDRDNKKMLVTLPEGLLAVYM